MERYITTGNEPVVNASATWAARTPLPVVCDAGAGPDIGGACFTVVPGARTVELLIRDETGRRISGVASFDDGEGTGQHFCESASVSVPPGATRLVVAVDSTTIRCGLATGGAATTGIVAASFS